MGKTPSAKKQSATKRAAPKPAGKKPKAKKPAAKRSKAKKPAAKKPRSTRSEGKKVLITGSSGYLGQALCRRLAGRHWVREIVGADLRPPPPGLAKVRFQKWDVTDPGLTDWVATEAPDVLVHLAFVLNPIHDEALMRRVNLGGTRNVLRAAHAAQVGQILVASSGTAYGAWPDNPVPIKESDPIRPHPDFQYAREKGQLEFDYQRYQREHPDTCLSIIRPAVVYGPKVDNYLSRLLTALPVAVGLAGVDPPLQFVHEDDVAGAAVAILEKRVPGGFNLAPPDTIRLSETMTLVNRPRLMLPDWLLTLVVRLAWDLHLPLLGAPPSFLDFLRYPWVLDTTRLQKKVGYRCRYSSRETLEIMLRAKGVLR